MYRHIRAQVLLVAGTILLCSVIYPMVLLLAGSRFFPDHAEGSMVKNSEGTISGSRLLAQASPGDEWFQPRPSAVDYNAAGSGGSNLGANNPKLRERVEKQLLEKKSSTAVPADAVTTSGSGLDPHITRSNAQQQLNRIIRIWAGKSGKPEGVVRQQIESLLTDHLFEPMWGLTGSEPLINVLEINLALHQAFISQP